MSVIRVLGVGSPFGDDRLGWQALEALGRLPALNRLPAELLSLVPCDRPGSRLLELMRGAWLVVIVDAMRSGATPGSVRRLDGSQLQQARELMSCHGFGVAEALALGQALGALPPRLTVFGIEAGREGAPLGSAQTERACARLAGLVLREIGELLGTQADRRPSSSHPE